MKMSTSPHTDRQTHTDTHRWTETDTCQHRVTDTSYSQAIIPAFLMIGRMSDAKFQK